MPRSSIARWVGPDDAVVPGKEGLMLELVIVILLVGLALYLVETYVPMSPPIDALAI